MFEDSTPQPFSKHRYSNRITASLHTISPASQSVEATPTLSATLLQITSSTATMRFMDLINQKIELFRLEQRYTRRRNRRSTFVSEAQYVDGEYIYSPTSSYSAKCSAGTSDSEEAESPTTSTASQSMSMSKASKRLSKMGLDKMDWRKGKDDKRQSRTDMRVSVREVKWDDSMRR